MEDYEEIYIEEESGDKKYFTLIPNFVLDHSTANILALYVHMKRFSGKDNKAFPSKSTLMKKLKISKPTLNKALEELEKKGWIRFDGEREVQTKGGIQRVHQYSIVDIWGQNNWNYGETKGVKNSTTSKGGKNNAERGVKISPKGGKNRPTKYNHLSISNEVDSVAEKPATDPKPKKDDTEDPMLLSEFVEWCRKSPLRHIQLIAEYADEKKLDFKTKGQWREFIKRNVRAAKQLSHYDDNQIDKAMAQIEKAKQGERGYLSRWTLETLVKYLDQ